MTLRLTPDTELDFTSSALPGGSLLASVYDRAFMQLSDRGGASNTVGDRWAELCAGALASDGVVAPALKTGIHDVVAEISVRLDDIPEIARTASKHKLQNPDFLMVGHSGDGQSLWAADAKFSVDTARSKQVSAEVIQGLLGLGDTVRRLLPDLHSDVQILDGVFLCPDYPLTHRLLRDRRGPRRATVHLNEVRFLPVTSAQFRAPMGQAGLQAYFAGLDALPIDPDESLMLALYYVRLARAALGCWQDQTAPLLAYHDLPVVDEAAVEAQARALTTMKTSAWGLIQRWNDVADQVRRQRVAVDQVTSLSINGKQLRAQLETASAAANVETPSSSRVRRAIGSWYRGKIRDEFGPIPPPVVDFGALLDDLERFARSLQPELARVTTRTIHEMVADAPPEVP